MCAGKQPGAIDYSQSPWSEMVAELVVLLRDYCFSAHSTNGNWSLPK